jgi:arsenite transporter
MIGKLLSALGEQGPFLLVVSLCMGLISHPLAHFGYSLLPVSAFLLTLGSFLTAGIASAEVRIRPSLVVLVLAWVGFAACRRGAPLVRSDRSYPPRRGVAVAAGAAGWKRRRDRRHAWLAIAPGVNRLHRADTDCADFNSCFATALGLGVAFDMQALAIRLFTIIGAAALVAFASLKFRNRLSAILPDQRAATGVAVIGLIIVGLATSQGIQAQLNSNPTRFEEMLAASAATNFGLCALGLVVFWRFGLRLAGTIGLVSGNRNVTLAWAAASFGLTPLAEGYVAACVIPVLALPLIIRLCIRMPSLFSRLLQLPATVRSL